MSEFLCWECKQYEGPLTHMVSLLSCDFKKNPYVCVFMFVCLEIYGEISYWFQVANIMLKVTPNVWDLTVFYELWLYEA